MPTHRILRSTSHRATFFRFAVAASAIAVIDIAVLYGLHAGLGTNVYVSRVVSYFAAMTSGYFLNRHFTFHQHERFRTILADLTRFYTVFAGGGLINYGVFAAVVAAGHQLGVGQAVLFWLPLVGVWLGGMVGMSFNYVASHKLVFQS